MKRIVRLFKYLILLIIINLNNQYPLLLIYCYEYETNFPKHICTFIMHKSSV